MIKSNYLRMLLEEEEKFVLSTAWMERKFDLFNEKYFDGRLPKPELKLNRTSTMHGCIRAKKNLYNDKLSFIIFLSKYFNKTTEHEFENVLIHEMIHQFNYLDKGFDNIVLEGKKAEVKGHGPSFIKEMERINSYGEHKVQIKGVANDKGESNVSNNMRDYTEEMSRYKFLLLTQKDKIYGMSVSTKYLGFVMQNLQKWNLFVCKNNDQNLYRAYPKFFRRNQKIKAGDILGKVNIEEILSSKKLEVEEVFIKDNCKLMYKPSVYTIEYLEDPQTYIDNGDNIKEKVNESVNRKRKKALGKIDMESLKQVFDNVELVGDELIVDLE